MVQKKMIIGALLVGFAMLTVVIVTSTHVAKAEGEAVKVVVNMDDFHFTVVGQDSTAPIELKAGQLYDMTIKNTGKYDHEIWWGKDAQMGDEGRLDGYAINLLEAVPVVITEAVGNDGAEINVPGLIEIKEAPGQEFTIEFTLPNSAAGKWEIGCFQPMPKATAAAPVSGTAVPDVPHYMVGMKLDLIVK